MARVTLKDVARQAGVSFKTVSRVLNNEPNVAPETTERVNQAILDLHYVPNSAARSLSSGKALSIGLVTGWSVNSPYVATLIEQTLEGCMHLGYSLALFAHEEGISHKILNAFLGKQIMGVMVDTNSARDTELMEQIHCYDVPHVIIHPHDSIRYPNSSYISIDNVGSARLAVEHLIGLGHRAIGYVTAYSGLSQEHERLDGYCEALAAAGIPVREDWVFKGRVDLRRSNPAELGLNGAKYLLSKFPEITAFFSETDEIALGIVSAVWQMGLKIPEDISVIGFDDISYAAMIVPPLSTIHQPIDEIARIAIQHLKDLIDNPNTRPLDVVVPTRLVIRNTCTTPRTQARIQAIPAVV